MRRRSWLVVLLLFVFGCSDSAEEQPYSTRPEPGVRREVFLVPGSHPADNPSGGATPATLDFTQVVRYRVDSAQPVPVSAVVIAMPGFLAGANTFDGLARTLVRRGRERGAPVEVWAIDRRANLLEDTFGLDLAEDRRDPSLAATYYREFSLVEGRVFAGFIDPSEVPYMSEWGLETHAEDLRRVIGLVPAAQRKGHVYLLGHSLGGSFVEAYAGWVFESDGVRGADELAGLIMIDGLLDGVASTEQEYLDGSSRLGFPTPGLTGIRANAPYTTLPVLGIAALVNVEIAALHAHFDPTGVLLDGVRDEQFSLLFGYPISQPVPPMTNRAALGLAFDSAHEPLPFVRATVGQVVGPTESFTSLFSPEPLIRPSDSAMTYDWIDGPTAPSEYASVSALAEAMVLGRGNLSEWYFPSRLPLDLAAVGAGTIAQSGFPASYGLRTFAGDQIDTPVLCIAAELVGDVARCDLIRDRVAPTVGSGRPGAGAGRGSAGEDTVGFRILDVTDMAHIDPVLATDHAQNPVPAKIEALLDENTAPGTFVVPRQAFPQAP